MRFLLPSSNSKLRCVYIRIVAQCDRIQPSTEWQLSNWYIAALQPSGNEGVTQPSNPMISIPACDTVDQDGRFSFSGKDEIFNDDDLENVEVEKVEKGRERNREHAKRTRLRKKAVLEGMKGKLMELQKEVRRSIHS
jgi:hypothetical protein